MTPPRNANESHAARVMGFGVLAAAYAVAPVISIEKYCLDNHYWTRRGEDPAFPRWLVQTATEIYYATKTTPRWKWRARTAAGGAAWLGIAISGCVALTAAKIIGFPLAVAALLVVAPVAGAVALVEEVASRGSRLARGVGGIAARATQSIRRVHSAVLPAIAPDVSVPTPVAGPEPAMNSATLRPVATRPVISQRSAPSPQGARTPHAPGAPGKREIY